MTQALKLIRPRSEPARMITVMAANTNWKNIIVAIGNASGGMPPAAAGIVAWLARNPASSAGSGFPRKGNHCGPKAML